MAGIERYQLSIKAKTITATSAFGSFPQKIDEFTSTTEARAAKSLELGLAKNIIEPLKLSLKLKPSLSLTKIKQHEVVELTKKPASLWQFQTKFEPRAIEPKL